jgi:hypothetical protein
MFMNLNSIQMKTKITISLILIVGLSLLNACTRSGQLPKDNQGREDFNAFQQKFYNDVNFQLSRIDFPITGKIMEDGRVQIIEEEQWKVLKPIDFNNPAFKVIVRNKAYDLIEQQVIVNQAFSIDLQFSLNPASKEWYLSSYSGISDVVIKADVDSTLLDSTRSVRLIDSESPEK